MTFFNFHQNNSGGSFDLDEAAGITAYVIVEAADYDTAVAKAEEIGLYWGGVESGQDCECCGDRWSTPWGGGTEVPLIYGRPVAEYGGRWMPEGKNVAVHFADGTVEWH